METEWKTDPRKLIRRQLDMRVMYSMRNFDQ